MVREAMEDCYRREGIDSRTHCKPLVKAYSQLIESPYWGMLKVRVLPASCRLLCRLSTPFMFVLQAPSKY